jgi:alkanesulfonate monooxygenase SsuD/methylene tetrahydromethanopterin reductase-like flavin-dependent oxidoreductase (luciferase family)
VELADRAGIDYVWEAEHHFLEEYSHSSAPEVFLAPARPTRGREYDMAADLLLKL